MIRLSLDWRKTSFNRTTGTTPLAITWCRTIPGPTEGSWSTSPTRISEPPGGWAASKWLMSGTSSMEHSSTTRRSHCRGFRRFLANRPVAGMTSSVRWMVLASIPVAWESRLAARPVGAHNRHCTFLALRIIRIEFIRVVLPTPGPPVITRTRWLKAWTRASL